MQVPDLPTTTETQIVKVLKARLGNVTNKYTDMLFRSR